MKKDKRPKALIVRVHTDLRMEIRKRYTGVNENDYVNHLIRFALLHKNTGVVYSSDGYKINCEVRS